jgi:hypothetical protein
MKPCRRSAVKGVANRLTELSDKIPGIKELWKAGHEQMNNDLQDHGYVQKKDT